MELERIYMIDRIPGYTDHISRLVSMMNYTRWTTLQAVQDLSVDQLDYLIDERSNSIGALLMHIAAVEHGYYISTLSNRDWSEEDRAKWWAAGQLGDLARSQIKNNPLSYYTDLLQEVRETTLNALKEKTDEWLDEYVTEPFLGNKPVNHYFKWFHVFEDELNHRGQIRIIRKRIQESTGVT